MTVLAVPYINQLTEGTTDGQPNENASWNCVVDSTCMGLEYETGKSYNGDAVKDIVYGQGYQGGMAAIRYVEYCHQQGVKLYAYNSVGASLDARQWSLVRQIHALVDAGHPVMATIPSQWGIAQADPEHPSGTTHVIVFYKTGAGTLGAHNPWNLPDHEGSDQYWHDRLCYAQLWIFAKETPTMAVPAGWTDVNGVLTAPNGKTVLMGMATFIRSHTWEADNVPVDDAEHYVSNLLAQDSRWGPGSLRIFRNCFLVYPTNPDPQLTTVTKNTVYRVDALGPEVAARDAQLTHLTAQLNALNAQVTTLTQQLATVTTDEQTDEATITDLTKKLATEGVAATEVSQIEKILAADGKATVTLSVVTTTAS